MRVRGVSRGPTLCCGVHTVPPPRADPHPQRRLVALLHSPPPMGPVAGFSGSLAGPPSAACCSASRISRTTPEWLPSPSGCSKKRYGDRELLAGCFLTGTTDRHQVGQSPLGPPQKSATTSRCKPRSTGVKLTRALPDDWIGASGGMPWWTLGCPFGHRHRFGGGGGKVYLQPVRLLTLSQLTSPHASDR
jgi:hypothetical protein